MNYESPRITELGSVADFTRGDAWNFNWDGGSMMAALTETIESAGQIPPGTTYGTS